MARRLRLKIAIIESGQTQRKIAHKLGYTESRLSDLITGAADPRPHEEVELSELLGRSREELFKDEAMSA